MSKDDKRHEISNRHTENAFWNKKGLKHLGKFLIDTGIARRKWILEVVEEDDQNALLNE
jgi:hypothetical protein